METFTVHQDAPPADFDALSAAITRRYDTLSKRLRQVAHYALQNPNDMALETIAVIAARAGVQPSTLVRFAKSLGFDGFSDMQRLFRDRLVERMPNYVERLRAISAHTGDGPSGLLGQFSDAVSHALANLQAETDPAQLDKAVKLIAKADRVHLAAQRRSFPVASYMAYLLGRLGRPFQLIDGVGGLFREQALGMGPKDVLVAISFQDYSADVVALAQDAAVRKVPVVAITDSKLSPLIAHATVAFEVHEAEVEHFRSLGATMVLVLALLVAVGAANPKGDKGTR